VIPADSDSGRERVGLSAFGSTQPVYDSVSDRVRWFCPWYVDTSAATERALDTLSAHEAAATAGRITARVVSRRRLSGECEQVLTLRGFNIEAVMVAGDSRNVTYIAQNGPGRLPDPADAANEQAMLSSILAEPVKGGAVIAEQFAGLNGFEVQRVSPRVLDRADIGRLVELHHAAFPAFPYDFETKLALMLKAPDNYLMYLVRSARNGKIYAFSNLEMNTVTLDDGSRLRLAEYDNSLRAAACREHGDVRGLGSIVRLCLARAACRQGVDLCHAESRASLAAINSISRHLGMRFGGTLQKHLRISGETSVDYREPSPFESMNVWYLDRKRLADLQSIDM
jgi:hypothetical protein